MEQKTYAFVRSRTFYREYDYRLLTPITQIPTSIHQYFERCVRNLLSDSSQNENEWDKPTWLLVKYDIYVLWGVAINNKEFSIECYQEEVASRPVRCFCGVVYANYDIDAIKLPYSVQAFKPVFDSVIGKYWKERVAEIPDVIISLGDAKEYIEPSAGRDDLNENPQKCRLLPASVNAKDLLSACLASHADTSIAVGAVEIDQVYNEKSNIALLNAVMRYGTSTIDVPLKQKCKKCGALVDKLVDGLCDECQKQRKLAEKEEIERIKKQEERILYTCVKCGNQKDWVNDKGICIDCEEKQYRKKITNYILIGLSILILLCVKMCSSRDKQQDVSSCENCISVDTIAHTYDSIYLSSQK